MNWNNSFLSIICISIVIAGCSNYRIQNLDVDGAMLTPLVHISSFGDTARFHLSGYVETSMNRQRTGNMKPGHTLVNDQGIFEGDTVYINRMKIDNDHDDGCNIIIREDSGKNVYSFNGNNFKWRLPKYSIGLGAYIPISKDSYWTLRMNISPGDENYYLGWGIGYVKDFVNEKYGYCYDIGFLGQQSSINAVYWRQASFDGPQNDYEFYFENEKQYRFGIYMAGVIFTTSPEQIINYFMQVSIQWQRLSFFRNSADIFKESRCSIYSFSFAPGIAYNFDKNFKLIGGLRFVSNLSIQNTNEYFIVMPFIQSNVIF